MVGLITESGTRGLSRVPLNVLFAELWKHRYYHTHTDAHADAHTHTDALSLVFCLVLSLSLSLSLSLKAKSAPHSMLPSIMHGRCEVEWISLLEPKWVHKESNGYLSWSQNGCTKHKKARTHNSTPTVLLAFFIKKQFYIISHKIEFHCF